MKQKVKEIIMELAKKINDGEYDASQIFLAGGIIFLVGIILGMCTSTKHKMVGCYNGSFVRLVPKDKPEN